MSTAKKLMGTTATGGFTAVEDIFQSWLYAGNGSTQTITNGIDLAGEGGMVWIKRRDTATNHFLMDTDRGLDFTSAKFLLSNATNAQGDLGVNYIKANSDGFEYGVNGTGTALNASGGLYASWTFRKAPRFFDVVTYTGDGVDGRQIAHNLGQEIGMLVVKTTTLTGYGWYCYHRSLGAGSHISLNSTGAANTSSALFKSTGTYNDSVFTVSDYAGLNQSGQTYVAYLFAHDPLGPSGDGSDGLIACGSYTGTGVEGNNTIQLGWEPQWILAKRADAVSGGWLIFDTMRGLPHGNPTNDAFLWANKPNPEDITTAISPEPTGFTLETAGGDLNASGGTYIYIAIRRGPMRQPESGSEVFSVDTYGSGSNPPSFLSGFPVDMMLFKNKSNTANWRNSARLIQQKQLSTDTTGAETTNPLNMFDYMAGWHNDTGTNTSVYSWMFRRAPGFFDVVAYTGDGSGGGTASYAKPHNLDAVPEMFWVKNRDYADVWAVYHKDLDVIGYGDDQSALILNGTNAAFATTNSFNTSPTDTNFFVGSANAVNRTGDDHIAYLFATLPSVSKVGSYTGNGSSQTINCGFTSGARFVLIKRADSTGDWYVWDTARGIVAANDPHLSLNTTAAEVTTDDSIDPDSSGFIVNQNTATNINVSSASYIFYAVS